MASFADLKSEFENLWRSGALAPAGALLCALAMGLIAVPVARLYPHEPVEPTARASAVAPVPTENINDLVHIGPFAALPAKPTGVMDPVDLYLCEVYRRTPTKKDGSGDFTWKDAAAAKRAGMDLYRYVIGGLHRDFREQLYHAGKAMDARGIRWSMLSAFRDDYRQKIASGLKARVGNSRHGGSRVTGGHGDGRAIDIAAAGPAGPVLRFIDTFGQKFGLHRPYRGFDPLHVEPMAGWHKRAAALRIERAGPDANRIAAAQDTTKVKGTKIHNTKLAKRHKAKKTRHAKRLKKHRRAHA